MQAKAAEFESEHKALQQKQSSAKPAEKKSEQLPQKLMQKTDKSKSSSQMDLISQAIKHQKELSSSKDSIEQVTPKQAKLQAPVAGLESALGQEPQNLADANDILSDLNQEPLQQALKLQDIKPEQNTVETVDIANEQMDKASPIAPKTIASPPPKKAESHPLNLQEKKDVKGQKNVKKEDKAQTSVKKVDTAKTSIVNEKDQKPKPEAAAILAAPKQEFVQPKKEEAVQPKKLETQVSEKVASPLTDASLANKDMTQLTEKQLQEMMAQQDPQFDLSALTGTQAQDIPLNDLQQQAPQQPSVSGDSIQKQAVPDAQVAPVQQLDQVSMPTTERIGAQSDLIKKLTQQAIDNQKSQVSQPTQNTETKQNALTQPAAETVKARVVSQPAKAPKKEAFEVKKAQSTQIAQKNFLPVKKESVKEVPKLQATKSQQDIIKDVLAKAQHQKQEQPAPKVTEPKPFEMPKAELDENKPLVESKPVDQQQDKQKQDAIQSVLNQMKKDQGEQKPTQVQQEAKDVQQMENQLQMSNKQALTQETKDDSLAAQSNYQMAQFMAADMPQQQPQQSMPDVKAVNEAPKSSQKTSQSNESLEELMQKFAESSVDDQTLTDKIIKQVEASDREEAAKKSAVKNGDKKMDQIPVKTPIIAPTHVEVPAQKLVEKSKPKAPINLHQMELKADPVQAEPVKAEPIKKTDQAKPSITEEVKTAPKQEPKPVAAPQSVDPTVPDKKSSSLDDALKPLDGFDKAFSGQEDFSEPLNADKLTAEIKPAVKDVKTGVKNADKVDASIAQKTESVKKPVVAKPAPKPVVKSAIKPVAKPVPKQQATQKESKPQNAKKPALTKEQINKMMGKPEHKEHKPVAHQPSKAAQKPSSKPVQKTHATKQMLVQSPAPKPSVPKKAVAPQHSAPQKVAPKPTAHIQKALKISNPKTSIPQLTDTESHTLLGHQNQLEQQLDEKIIKKLEQEEGRDADADDDKRLNQQIQQIMAETGGAADPEPAPKKEEPKKEEPKKEEPKKEEAKKPEEPPKEEKKDKPAPPPPPPKEEKKKPDLSADLDDYYGDHYYDDDPYFVHRRSRPLRSDRKRHRAHYIDEDILDSLTGDGLMHRLLQDLHIHNDHSAQRAIDYLEQHHEKDTLALRDLLAKAKELDSASSQIEKTQKAMKEEKAKIHSLLESLIKKMDKERTAREKRAIEKIRELEKEDQQRRRDEEKDILEQEKIARAVVDQENRQHEKADALAERYIELKEKDERVQNTLRAVKQEGIRVRRDLEVVKMHAKEAKEAAKRWQEKEAERLGKDKDRLLQKYLRSRSQNEIQLHDLEKTVQMKQQKASPTKLGQVDQISADSFSDDRVDAGRFDRRYNDQDQAREYSMDRRRDHDLETFRDHYSDYPYEPYYDSQYRHPPSRRLRDVDHPEFMDDDPPFDGRSLLDSVQRLKRLQRRRAQSDCKDMHEVDMGGSGGLDSNLDHIDDLLKSTRALGGSNRNTRSNRRPPRNSGNDEWKMAGDEANQGGADIGDEDHEFEGRSVRGLSNQIREVKRLRKFSPFKDVKVAQKQGDSGEKRPQLPNSLAGNEAPASSAPPKPAKSKKQERGAFALDAQQQPRPHDEKKLNLNKINDLLKQVKSLTVSDSDTTPSSKI